MSLSKYKASTLALAEIKNEDSKYCISKICDCRAVLQAEQEEKKLAKEAMARPDAGAVPSEAKEGQSAADNTSSAAITTATLAIAPLSEVAEVGCSQGQETSSPPLSTAPSSEAEQLQMQQELLAVESLTKQLQDGDGMDLTEKGFWIRAKIAAELFDDSAATAGSTDDNNKGVGAHTGPGGDSAAADDDDDDVEPVMN
jgi:hypothetical protein